MIIIVIIMLLSKAERLWDSETLRLWDSETLRLWDSEYNDILLITAVTVFYDIICVLWAEIERLEAALGHLGSWALGLLGT
jgi:hypothetical protein